MSGEAQKQKKPPCGGDLLAASLAAALYLDFLVNLSVGIFALGLLIVNPIFGVLTAVLVLLGLVGFPIARRMGASRLWRRLLTGALASGFLVIAFFCLAYIAMVLAWN